MKTLQNPNSIRRKRFYIIKIAPAAAVLIIMTVLILNNPADQKSKIEASEANSVELSEYTTNQTSLGTNTLLTDESDVDWNQVQLDADKAADQMELKVLQTAMDTMMIGKGLKEVRATRATDDMSSFPTGTPLYPEYLRDQTSHKRYTCDITGQIYPAN
jgi:hypothetical protein